MENGSKKRQYEEAIKIVEELLQDEEFLEKLREIRRYLIKRKKI